MNVITPIYLLLALIVIMVYISFLGGSGQWEIPIFTLERKIEDLEKRRNVLKNRFFVSETEDAIGIVAPEGDILRYQPITEAQGFGRMVSWTNKNSTLSNKASNFASMYLKDSKKFIFGSLEGTNSVQLS